MRFDTTDPARTPSEIATIVERVATIEFRPLRSP